MTQSRTPQDVGASISMGSDEMVDYCQPCGSEKQLKPAGFCQVCRQYLCVSCIEYHSKLTATACHTVVSIAAMPNAKVQQKFRNNDVLVIKCQKHPDEVMKYFCKTHDQICCEVCFTLDHNLCPGRSHIPDISSGIENNKIYHKLKVDLDRLVDDISCKQENMNHLSKHNDECHTKALANIEKVRMQINSLSNEFEEESKRKAEKNHQDNVGIIENVSESCQSLRSEVNSIKTNIVALEAAGKSNQLFVQVKMCCNRTKEISTKFEESGDCKLTPYALNQGEVIQKTRSSLSTALLLTMRDTGTRDAATDTQNDEVYINLDNAQSENLYMTLNFANTHTKARHMLNVSAKTDMDTEKCSISGIALLDNGRIVISDFMNKAVKQIDLEKNKVISYLTVVLQPYDITVIESNQVAVIMVNAIQIITVTDSLSIHQTIKLPGKGATGICHDGSNFFLAYQNPGRIKIVNMSGKTLNTFSTDGNGTQLFTSPWYIAVGRAKTVGREKIVIYVTDVDANTVTSLTLSGSVNWIYKHEKLQHPLGLAVGKYGSVYVCSKESNTIHQLTPSGDILRIILDTNKGLAHQPYAIAYDYENDMLYISSYNSVPQDANYISLFKLK